jgi:hypothetical protein
MAIYVELGALLFMLFIIYLIIHFLKNPLMMIYNSIIGIVVFYLLNAIFHLGIAVNFWSIAIVALGGIGGVIMVLILHFLGLAF